MSGGPARAGLTKEKMAHLLRAAAAISAHRAFVIIGTGAVVAQLRIVPFALLQTRAIDIYADGAADVDAVSDLIDGSIGEGSSFDSTFGYYAHGVGETTACLPDDWRSRARSINLPGLQDVTLVCPDPTDIALSKLCAWREKDVEWLNPAVRLGVVSVQAMRELAPRVGHAAAPPLTEIMRRLAALP